MFGLWPAALLGALTALKVRAHVSRRRPFCWSGRLPVGDESSVGCLGVLYELALGCFLGCVRGDSLGAVSRWERGGAGVELEAAQL